MTHPQPTHPPTPSVPGPSKASPFDSARRQDEAGEHWSARDLQVLLGYDQWRRFEDAIERAMASAANAGIDVRSAFSQVVQVVGSGNLGDQQRKDYRLTRYACYLVAMNGDPRKKEIAAAQTYFAVKTREAEIAPAAPALPRSYAEALRELAATVEERDAAQQQLAIAAPKAEAWNTLASADGDFSVADAAKILSRDPQIQLGERRLFTLLREWGWIYRQGVDQRWRVYQQQVETGRLSEIPQSHYHPRNGELVLDPPQVRVTVKGIDEIRRRLTGQLAIGGVR